MKRCLIVIAKRPVPGQVKTRIGATLGFERAAAVYQASLEDTLELVGRYCESHPDVSPAVSFAPPDDEARAYFGGLAPGFALVPQFGADLGERLLGAFVGAAALGAAATVLIGTDNPSLPQGRIEAAFAALEAPGISAVLGPVTDGGYYLIGMREPQPALFAHIAWSTEVVADQTRERAREAGLSLAEVPVWYDLDLAEDLGVLSADLARSRDGRAPRTGALVDRLEREGLLPPFPSGLELPPLEGAS